MFRVFLYFLVFLFPLLGRGERKEDIQEKEVEGYIDKAYQSSYSNPVRAISFSNTAILKAELSGNNNLVCRALVVLGRSYVNLGSFDMGFEAFYNALDKCPPDNEQLQAQINVNIGYLYISLGDIKKAFQFIERATELFTALGDTAGIASCYNAEGLAYERIEEDGKAEFSLQKSLALNRQLNDRKNIAANLNNLGLLEGKPEEKIEWLKEAIQINKSLGANWSLAENYNNLGTQYFYKKDYEKALEELNSASVLATNLGAKELLCDNYRYQTWVYKAMGNYKKAYESMERLYEMEKELLSDKKIREMELNVADRRFKAQQQELNLKQKELKIKSLERDMLLVIAFSLALFFGLFLGVWRFRHRRKIQLTLANREIEVQRQEMIRLQLEKTEEERRNVEMELEFTKKELTNFACYMQSKNELIEKIKVMIRESYKDAKPEVKTQLKTINAFISQYQNKEENAGPLIEEIERINAEFIVRLTTIHPDLSKNEKQLASFLRIDFSTKEIALLIGSTPKTVNMARYRLRKKLGLETDEGLSEYMKKM